MTSLGAPLFSPPPSEGGDRATSPALSSSSRTTTSIPTDVSDLDSLDGDDYEVIDGPVYMQDADHEATDGSSDASRIHHQDSSIASEIDGSSFLAPHYHALGLEEENTQQQQQQQQQQQPWSSTHTGRIHPSTSLTTLQLEPEMIDSQGSGLLRFPDPLHESFQQERPSSTHSAGSYIDSEGEDPRLFQKGEAMTPMLAQGEVGFATSASTGSNAEQAGNKDGNDISHPRPVGSPYNWNKRLIFANIARIFMGFIVVIISTGVLPVWPRTTAVPEQVMRPCQSGTSSWADTLLGRLPICSSMKSSKRASNELIVSSRNHSGVFSSVTSLKTRPTSKAVQALRTRELSIFQQECNSLSLYMAETHMPRRSECMKYCSTCKGKRPKKDSVSTYLSTYHTSFDGFDLKSGELFAKDSWKNAQKIARERRARASKNAKALSTSFRKEWSVWVKELSEIYHGMLYSTVEAVRLQSLAQKEATKDAWNTFHHSTMQVMAYLQKQWAIWMQDAHITALQLKYLFRTESIRFRRDADMAYRTIWVALRKQYSQAVKGADIAQKSLTKAWQSGDGPIAMHRIQSDMMAAKTQLMEKASKTSRLLRDAAEKRKRIITEKAVRRRMEEINLLRAKHRKMMTMVQEQSKLKNKADKWIRKGKVAIYRKAIQSVQAKHKMENMLNKMAGGKKFTESRKKSKARNSSRKAKQGTR